MLDQFLKVWYILLRIVFKGLIIIRKIPYKRKIWLDRNSKRLLKKRRRDKVRHKKIKYLKNTNGKNSGKKYTLKAPKIFSIEDNPKETIAFFKSIIEKRKTVNRHMYNIFVDCYDVEKIEVTALMYLVAIIRDVKFNKLSKCHFRGNLPKNDEASQTFINSGFLDYVNVNKPISSYQNKRDNIRILRGKNNSPQIAGQVCEYVQKQANYTRLETFPLYEMLVEMMGNTCQHAYSLNTIGIFCREWYIYAENTSDKIKFVFLDTGVGIPSTVYKKLIEIIPLISKKDSELIKSALDGDFRTQTQKYNRGKGLPQISSCFKKGLLKNVLVYSGRGCCKLSAVDGGYELMDYEDKIFGTLFSWEIPKKEEL